MSALGAALRYLEQGGGVMLPLTACLIALWYAVGYRAWQLRPGTRLLDAVRRAARGGASRARLDEALAPEVARLDRSAGLARTLVAVAPLLGLLGTVTGMIEMFDSLGTGEFQSQEGGIAAGISTALFTTEYGLAIAIPGYFVTRVLDRRAGGLKDDLERHKALVCLGREPVPA